MSNLTANARPGQETPRATSPRRFKRRTPPSPVPAQASEVDYGRIPDWLRDRCIEQFGVPDDETGSLTDAGIVAHAFRGGEDLVHNGGNWLDNWGSSYLTATKLVFVTEPHRLTPHHIRHAMQLADRLGVSMGVFGLNYTRPGDAVRVVFFP